MPYYIVTTREVHIQDRFIEAENKQEAMKAVANGEGLFIDGTFEYSHTLNPETWTIRKATDSDLNDGTLEEYERWFK